MPPSKNGLPGASCKSPSPTGAITLLPMLPHAFVLRVLVTGATRNRRICGQLNSSKELQGILQHGACLPSCDAHFVGLIAERHLDGVFHPDTPTRSTRDRCGPTSVAHLQVALKVPDINGCDNRSKQSSMSKLLQRCRPRSPDRNPRTCFRMGEREREITKGSGETSGVGVGAFQLAAFRRFGTQPTSTSGKH